MKFLRGVLKKWREWREYHLLLGDAILAFVVIGGAIALGVWKWSIADLSAILNGSRAAVYGSIAAICGSMFGFVLTAISIILVFGGMEKFSLLRTTGQYEQVFRVFFHATYCLAICTVWALLALIFDSDKSPNPPVQLMTAAISALVCMRIYRCIWVLREMLSIAIGPID